MSRTLSMALLSAVASACAGLGGDEGGGDNLPNRGVVPYERVGDDDAPYVVAPPTAPALRLEHPSALLRDDGGVDLFFARVDPAGASPPEIVRVVGDAQGTAFAPPMTVLAAATAPGVTRDREGRTWLAYLASDGRALTLATESAPGAFAAVGQPLLAPGDTVFEGPSLLVGDGVTVFFGRRATPDAPPAIWRVDASLDGAFEAPFEVLTPGTGCLGTDGEPEDCFDADGATDPEARVSVTATGRLIVRLFYVGILGNDSAIGFAASHDGLAFSRYAFNPVLNSRFDEGSPTNLRVGDRYLLYYGESRTVIDAGVALSVNAADAPSETF